MTADLLVWFNPNCSKCRGLKALLEERGLRVEYRHYLDQPPTSDELRSLMRQLGIEDPRAMIRTKEAVYGELGLEQADEATVLEAIRTHPRLLERPILVRQERAFIARPPEDGLRWLDT